VGNRLCRVESQFHHVFSMISPMAAAGLAHGPPSIALHGDRKPPSIPLRQRNIAAAPKTAEIIGSGHGQAKCSMFFELMNIEGPALPSFMISFMVM
jgi:hypothetical protein